MTRLRDLLQDEADSQDTVDIQDSSGNHIRYVRFYVEYATGRGFWLMFRGVAYALGAEGGLYILRDREEVIP